MRSAQPIASFNEFEAQVQQVIGGRSSDFLNNKVNSHLGFTTIKFGHNGELEAIHGTSLSSKPMDDIRDIILFIDANLGLFEAGKAYDITFQPSLERIAISPSNAVINNVSAGYKASLNHDIMLYQINHQRIDELVKEAYSTVIEKVDSQLNNLLSTDTATGTPNLGDTSSLKKFKSITAKNVSNTESRLLSSYGSNFFEDKDALLKKTNTFVFVENGSLVSSNTNINYSNKSPIGLIDGKYVVEEILACDKELTLMIVASCDNSLYAVAKEKSQKLYRLDRPTAVGIKKNTLINCFVNVNKLDKGKPAVLTIADTSEHIRFDSNNSGVLLHDQYHNGKIIDELPYYTLPGIKELQAPVISFCESSDKISKLKGVVVAIPKQHEHGLIVDIGKPYLVSISGRFKNLKLGDTITFMKNDKSFSALRVDKGSNQKFDLKEFNRRMRPQSNRR